METKSNKKLGIVLFVLSSLFAIGILEGGLRFFTYFPLGPSNKENHSALGYVLSSRFPDVDSFGFRNAYRNRRGGEVAAIGDSHTYGIQVSSSESWPAILSDKTGRDVYNYGIPGYSPYQYHFLVKQAINDGAKYVIVALLLQLDEGSDLGIPCDLMTTEYYQEFDKLVDNNYEILCSKFMKTDLNDNHVFWKRAKEVLKTKIAITSAAYWLVYRKHWSYSRFEKSYGKITYRIRIEQPLLNGFESRIASLKETLRSIRDMCSLQSVACGILLLPSVGRTISLVKSDNIVKKNESILELKLELALVDDIKRFLTANDMAFTDAAPYVASAFQERLSIGNEFEVIVPWDSHPRRAGYVAYADAAIDLLNKLTIQRRK